LARLRSGEAPKDILHEIRGDKPDENASPHERYLYYGVMAEAALAAEDPALTVIALEQWYRLQPPVRGGSELFAFDPDTLWQNYLAFAMKVGNAEQLLIGNDDAWLKLAEQTDKRYPIRKRSLYALISQRGYHPESREQASLKLATLLQEQENGMAVVEQLFLRSGRYPDAAQLPTGVAYLLVDAAIHDGDLSMASQLLSALPEPPDNTAKFPWQLRRVKVFILAGKITAAVELLHQLIQAIPSYSETQRDQLIQLLFDLQTVGENEAAYQLLAQVYQLAPDLELRRELLFWMADSRNAQGKYAEAARLYLQSATLIDVKSMDPWAQTARYNAAEALAKGGMLSDAAHIYVQLLKVTKKADRRAVLRRGLEKVRMRQAADEQ
jgi:tetratricopeptide (TPR) repeat protein